VNLPAPRVPREAVRTAEGCPHHPSMLGPPAARPQVAAQKPLFDKGPQFIDEVHPVVTSSGGHDLVRLHRGFAWDSGFQIQSLWTGIILHGKCGSLVASTFSPVQPRISSPAAEADDPRHSRLPCRHRLVGAITTAAACHHLHPRRVSATTTVTSWVRTAFFP